MSVFGDKLKELRERRQETQPGLAKVLDVTIRQVQRYEDETLPPLEKIKQLAIHYQYDFFRLFSDEIFPGKTNLSDKGDDLTDKYIKVLEQQNNLLVKTIDELFVRLNNVEENQKKIETNLNDLSSTQKVIVAQIGAESRLSAERYAGKDLKKLREESDKLRRYVAELSK